MMQTKVSAVFSLVTIAVVSASYIGPNPIATTQLSYQPGHIISEFHFISHLI